MTFRILLLALISCGTAIVQADDRPNILLIVADDMGYGDLSCYGSKQISTPHLDRLAAHGVRCTDGYVSGSVCAPSRAGLLTGRYGSRFGFEHNLHQPDYLRPEFAGIPLDEPLISDRLKKLGYRTGIVGKWHVGEALPEHHPNARGFDFFFGMLGGGHSYFPTSDQNKLLYNREKVSSIRVPYLTDWFTLEALDFIQGQGKAKTTNQEQPWFLYLSYNSPHSPMQAKPEDIARYKHIEPKTRRIYCAMQHCMDQNIGKIIDHLQKNKQLENTLIVFISDNGGSVEVSHAVNAPLNGSKGTFLEGGIRVPTIYHWPAQLQPKVYPQPVISLDFMATFVSAAQGTLPETSSLTKKKKRRIYDSVNLIPHFKGEITEVPHQTLHWRTVLRGSAIRSGDWKLLIPNSSMPQLYNLAQDIGETNNVIHKHPEIVKQLLKKRLQWEVSLERPPMFASAAYWTGYSAKLYAKDYSRVQPEPDDSTDIWSFQRPTKKLGTRQSESPISRQTE
ncbi:sulfatase-like hydrolase/transferase [Verrucomicrobiaceae bacterium N1E253]|uniref:Sulfatase-like hydrolase/transferase n=1 Tax=Oceaniferula marina TaxID=2748318 RepID=A0A851GE43_9BACT|nr:sulfatase-like hydrolase/transferase [Oceaniferula marina]NWK55429.1 sulfatase-like hydrolase/transferase [Oceaniferula marina]